MKRVNTGWVALKYQEQDGVYKKYPIGAKYGQISGL